MRVRANVVIASAAACLAAACGIPRSADSLASRCAMGIDMAEASGCRATTTYELQEMRRSCPDPASVARIRKLEATCSAAQTAAAERFKGDRRAVRARYLEPVSALLLDPAYAPLVDRHKDLEERAFHGDAEARREVESTRGELGRLAKTHGVDPAHAKELDLW